MSAFPSPSWRLSQLQYRAASQKLTAETASMSESRDRVFTREDGRYPGWNRRYSPSEVSRMASAKGASVLELPVAVVTCTSVGKAVSVSPDGVTTQCTRSVGVEPDVVGGGSTPQARKAQSAAEWTPGSGSVRNRSTRRAA